MKYWTACIVKVSQVWYGTFVWFMIRWCSVKFLWVMKSFDYKRSNNLPKNISWLTLIAEIYTFCCNVGWGILYKILWCVGLISNALITVCILRYLIDIKGFIGFMIDSRYPVPSKKICQYPQDGVLSSRKPKLVQRFFSLPPIRQATRQ